MKLLFCDVETTGTNPDRHSIYEVAGLIVIDDEIVDEFCVNMCPPEGTEYDRMAFIKSNRSAEELKNFQSESRAFVKIIDVLSKYVDPFDKTDKFFFIGYFALFDDRFFRKLWDRQGDRFYSSWFHVPVLDLSVLAGFKLMKDRHKMINFKLETVVKHLGIELDEGKTHQADYDVHLTKKIWEKIKKM